MGYDPLNILNVLLDKGVRFVVIGGVAGRLWGSPTMTNDIDICYARDPDNLHRLVEALRRLGVRLRGVDDDVPFLLDPETLAKGMNFSFICDSGPLDLLGEPAGVRGYEELEPNASPMDLGSGIVVEVCDLEDLIRMKRAAGRAKDRIELEVLGAVREERRTSDSREDQGTGLPAVSTGRVITTEDVRELDTE